MLGSHTRRIVFALAVTGLSIGFVPTSEADRPSELTQTFATSQIRAALTAQSVSGGFWIGKLQHKSKITARRPHSLALCPEVSIQEAPAKLNVTHNIVFGNDFKRLSDAGLIGHIHKTGYLGFARLPYNQDSLFEITCEYGASLVDSTRPLILASDFLERSKDAVAYVSAIAYTRQLEIVTGITSPKYNRQEVEFSYRYKPTTFGQLLDNDDPRYMVPNTLGHGRAMFVRHGDGWRFLGIRFHGD